MALETPTKTHRGQFILLRLLAILVFLIGTAGVQDALAVSLSATGAGETLIFPYYTTRNNYATTFTLTNTTSSGKAVRISFREALGGKYVLSFNLYLSPNDQWGAALTANASGGVNFSTVDESCTVPSLQYRNLTLFPNAYQNPPDVFSKHDLSRLTEGYLEVIEMGQIPPGSQLEFNIAPLSGKPRDCSWIVSQMANPQGINGAPSVLEGSLKLNSPTGGLTGQADLIRLSNGQNFTYAALALNSFLGTPRHTTTGYDDLTLDSAAPVAVISGHLTHWSRGVDAVSAVLTTRKLFGSLFLDPAIDASTTLIAVSPTRPFYAGRGPFSITEPACEPAGLSIFDSSGTSAGNIPAQSSLCSVASVWNFGDDMLNAFGTNTVFLDHFKNGSFSLNLISGSPVSTPSSTVNFGGLPIVGLVLQRYNTTPGGQSNQSSALYAATDYNVFTFRTPVGSLETVSTLIKFAPADIGKPGSIFITGSIPAGSLSILNGSVSSGLMNGVSSSTTAGGKVPVQLTPSGWQYLMNGQLIAYTSGVIGDLTAAQTVLQNTDTSRLAGAQFCLGYGASASEMLDAKRMTTILKLEGAAASDSCIVDTQSISSTGVPAPGLWAIDDENNGQPGRGFQIVSSNGTLVMTFYGYRPEGTAQWYLSSGSLVNGSYSGTLDQYNHGTSFGNPYAAAQKSGNAGTVSLSFTDGTHGQIVLPGESAKAVSLLNFAGSANVSLPTTPASGLWVIDTENNGQPGRGFQIAVQNSVMVLTFYGYKADGSAQWYLSSGSISGSNMFSGTLDQYVNGTAFGKPYAAALRTEGSGTVNITFTDSTHGQITLPGESTKNISLFTF